MNESWFSPQRILAPTIAALGLVMLGLLFCANASGKSAVREFSLLPLSTPTSHATQAGGHPDLFLEVGVGTHLTDPIPCECNDPKDIAVNTPPGVVGTPTDVPQCSAAEFAANACPSDTQVGLLVFDREFTPVYNLPPRADELALLGGVTPASPQPTIYTSITARTEGDYGLEFTTRGISRLIPIPDFKQIVWGVPADPIHDWLRFPQQGIKLVNCLSGDRDPLPELLANEYPLLDCPFFLDPEYGPSPPKPLPANSAMVPFLSSPTACTGPLSSTIETLAYDGERDHGIAPYPAISGCDQLTFNPSLTAKPTTGNADSPSGLDIDLSVPQTLSPSTPTPSAIRDVTVTLPPGLTLNAGAANGKVSCTNEQARFGTREPAQCPEFAKIGTLGVTSSSFPRVLPGAIYLGEPLPGDRYRLILVFDGFSLHVKLPGTARPDSATGQIIVSFSNLPQFNFQDFDMHFFGAERGLLSTPSQCGTYPVHTEFVPWASPDLPTQTSTQYFKIDAGPGGASCPPAQLRFGPHLRAGVVDNTGGKHTTFAFDLQRSDGEQNLAAVQVSNPPGFAARLAGIPYCPDGTLTALEQSSYLGVTELTVPVCSASKVGTAVASVGAGSRPVALRGNVYLAGPYNGAPLSLAVVTPAVSGPYDLGNVVVRVGVSVDPRTAQVRAASDPLPRIVEGIPLRYRRLLVTLDRGDFVLNPTNCARFSISSTVFGSGGALADLQNHFQVANCGTLDFSPKLRISVKGALARTGHPGIHARLRARSGEANLRRVQVTLPSGMLLDNSHIKTICTKVRFREGTCPMGARIGWAEARTPLLAQPLKGAAYLRSSTNRLPDIAVDLKGQLDIELVGRVDAINGRLRTTFSSIPDVPVSQFHLRLAGGAKGLVTNSEGLCGSVKRARVVMAGQNGRRLARGVKLRTSCNERRRERRSTTHRRASGTDAGVSTVGKAG